MLNNMLSRFTNFNPDIIKLDCKLNVKLEIADSYKDSTRERILVKYEAEIKHNDKIIILEEYFMYGLFIKDGTLNNTAYNEFYNILNGSREHVNRLKEEIKQDIEYRFKRKMSKKKHEEFKDFYENNKDKELDFNIIIEVDKNSI